MALQTQNISLANKITSLKRKIVEISKKYEGDTKKNRNVIENLDIFKIYWKKVKNIIIYLFI